MKRGEPYTPAPAPALPPADDGLEVLDTELVREPPETHSDSRRAMRRRREAMADPPHLDEKTVRHWKVRTFASSYGVGVRCFAMAEGPLASSAGDMPLLIRRRTPPGL